MAASVESPFLKKFEGKITIVNKDGHAGERNDSKGRRRDQKMQSSISNTNTPSAPLSPQISQGNGGTIQVNRGFLDNAQENTNSLPLRQHPSIFSDTEPSIEHLRKISAENKYRDYSDYSPSPNSTNVYNSPPYSQANYPYNPNYNSNYNSNYTNNSNYPPANYPPNTNYPNPNLPNPNFTNSNYSHPSKSSPATLRSQVASLPTKTTNSQVYSPPHSGRSRHNSQPDIVAMQSSNVGPMHTNPQYQPPIFPSTFTPNPYDNIPQHMYYQQPPVSAPTYPYHPPSNPPSQASPYTPAYPHQTASPSNALPTSASSSSPTKEQLYFSKQPREVYFKPHNLSDYRRLKEELSSLKMGNLGPDLQSAEYLAKKEQKDKMKEYARNVRTMHTTSGLPTGPGKLPEAASPLEDKRLAKEKRDKAKEYASKIPKPRPRPQDGTTGTSGSAPTVNSCNLWDDDDDDNLDEDEDEMMIREMEKKHQMARDNVLQIRKEFGLT